MEGTIFLLLIIIILLIIYQIKINGKLKVFVRKYKDIH